METLFEYSVVYGMEKSKVGKNEERKIRTDKNWYIGEQSNQKERKLREMYGEQKEMWVTNKISLQWNRRILSMGSWTPSPRKCPSTSSWFDLPWQLHIRRWYFVIQLGTFLPRFQAQWFLVSSLKRQQVCTYTLPATLCILRENFGICAFQNRQALYSQVLCFVFISIC